MAQLAWSIKTWGTCAHARMSCLCVVRMRLTILLGGMGCFVRHVSYSCLMSALFQWSCAAAQLLLSGATHSPGCWSAGKLHCSWTRLPKPAFKGSSSTCVTDSLDVDTQSRQLSWLPCCFKQPLIGTGSLHSCEVECVQQEIMTCVVLAAVPANSLEHCLPPPTGSMSNTETLSVTRSSLTAVNP